MALQGFPPHALSEPGARMQHGESLGQPAYMKARAARPMVQRVAGSGVYFRVNVLREREDQIEVYYPPYESDPEYREWVFRTSDRIHRTGSGKWSYVGRGGWRFNSKGGKKRSRAKSCDGRPQIAHDGASVARASHEPRLCDASASECSLATSSSGSKVGASGNNAIAAWFEMHLRVRQAVAGQDGDRVVACGPAVAPRLHSSTSASVDVQSRGPQPTGDGVTSARQLDSAARCQADVTCPQSVSSRAAPQPSAAQQRSHHAEAHPCCVEVVVAPPPKYEREAFLAQLKVPHDPITSPAAKHLTVSGEHSPDRHDSRRSSSTLEAPDCKADSRLCAT